MKKFKSVISFYFLAVAGVVCLLTFAGCGKGGSKKSKPGSLHYELGMQKYEAGDYEGAMNFYLKAIQIDPSSEKAYLDLGILYEDYKGNISKAMDCYQKYLLIRSTGEKAEMVKGWLLKLAVTNPNSVEPKLTSVSKQVSQTLSSVEGEMDTKKYEKQIQALQSQLEAAAQTEEQLRNSLKEKTDLEAKLKEAQKTADGSKEVIKKLEQQSQKKPDETAIVKRETVKFEEEKIDLKEKYEAELKELRQEAARAKKDKEAAEAKIAAAAGQASVSMQQKGKTEEVAGQLRSELDRLKGAFSKATEERARLEKMLTSRDAEIKGLEANLSSAEKGRVANSAFDRASYQRQIVMLQQKIKSLEEDRNRYLLIAKQAHKELAQTGQTQMLVRSEPAEAPAPRSAAPTLSAPAKKDYELVTYHRVKRGETLMMIAGYDHIYGDRSKWKIIYEANKDNIDDPNVLVPGQILLVPR